MSKLTQISVSEATPTLSTHAAYAANDFVGTDATAIEFTNAAAYNGGTGIIQAAVLVDAVVASVAGELWLFDTAITPPNDSAAWTLSAKRPGSRVQKWNGPSAG